MVFTIHGVKYRATWKHRHNPENHRDETVCEIFKLDGNKPAATPVSTGVATCSFKDNFNKNKGRKISLQDAMGVAIYENAFNRFLYYEWHETFKDPNIRAEVWAAYRDMRHGAW